MSSELQHRQLHAGSQPALGHSLPQVEGRLVDVDDLVISILLHVISHLPHVVVLLQSQLLILGLILPVSVVGSLEFYFVSSVVSQKSCIAKTLQLELLLDEQGPLSEAEVAHLL